MTYFKLDPMQNRALEAMQDGVNIFLTGKAGTGKSTIVRKFLEDRLDVVCMAPTGLAAMNINGATIHRALSIDVGPIDVNEKLDKPSVDQVKKYKSVNTILIDEISMVRSDLFFAIDRRLKQICKNKKPFGGKQIIAVGDFFQLPPVVVSNEEREYLEEVFGGIFAFQTKVWKTAEFIKIDLQNTFRQSDNKLIENLNGIREGNVSCIDFFNKRCIDHDEDILRLATTNKKVWAINKSQIDKIKSESVVSKASIYGEFREQDYPTDRVLELKVGSKVMTIVNGEGFVNGSVGVLKRVKQGEDGSIAYVSIKIGGSEVNLQRNKWEICDYVYNRKKKKIEKEVVGSFSQFPIKPAWAITIHKSQGQSLEKAVLDLGRGAFAHGQLYVALSRLKSFDGLYVERPIKEKDLIVDEAVREYMGVDNFDSVTNSNKDQDDSVTKSDRLGVEQDKLPIEFFTECPIAEESFEKVTNSKSTRDKPKNIDSVTNSTNLENDMEYPTIETPIEKVTNSKKGKRKGGTKGGSREGAGRKKTWPSGVDLKVMRLPANLEGELKDYARKLLKERGY